jgi:putative ABC transport system permease protein
LAAPVIEIEVELASSDRPNRALKLLGIDPIEETSLRGPQSFAASGGEFALRLLAEPGTILVGASLAAELALAEDSPLQLRSGESTTQVTIAGTHGGADASAAATIITDLSTAQMISGLPGISRIDLRLTEAQATELGASPPGGTALVPAGNENSELQAMTRAFTTNLLALGLLALVVGMFLIYSTISFAIVQRRRALATVRALGLQRRELVACLLTEATVIGGIGTLLGLALGQILASGLLELVLRTMDDLYFRRTLATVPQPAGGFVEGLALGAIATFKGAQMP